MIKFGPAGNCKTFYDEGYKRTLEAPKWLKEKGLDAYEYSFGRGILLSDEMSKSIGEECAKYGVEISVHAPYFINFANPSDEEVEKSYAYVINSLKKLRLLGGNRLVVHTASCGKSAREDAIKLVYKRLEILKNKIIENGFGDMWICLETMGKSAQIGTYEEIIDMCKVYDKFMPTFDFGHINALTNGGLRSKEDYAKILDYLAKILPDERSKNIHVHFSKIEYAGKGEIRHLTLEDDKYGPEFEPLAQLLKERNISGVIISESKEYMARDAIILQDIYKNS